MVLGPTGAFHPIRDFAAGEMQTAKRWSRMNEGGWGT